MKTCRRCRRRKRRIPAAVPDRPDDLIVLRDGRTKDRPEPQEARSIGAEYSGPPQRRHRRQARTIIPVAQPLRSTYDSSRTRIGAHAQPDSSRTCARRDLFPLNRTRRSDAALYPPCRIPRRVTGYRTALTLPESQALIQTLDRVWESPAATGTMVGTVPKDFWIQGQSHAAVVVPVLNSTTTDSNNETSACKTCGCDR